MNEYQKTLIDIIKTNKLVKPEHLELFNILEKETPKKPTSLSIGYDTSIQPKKFCNICNINLKDKSAKYCSNCGNAIDWKESAYE